MEPIAPGIGADKHQQVPSTSSSRPEQLFLLSDANTHDVDQRVLRIGITEEDLAADVGDAEAVAIAGNSGDNTGE